MTALTTGGVPKDEPRVISSWSIDTLYTHLSRVDADAALLASEHFRLNELRYTERSTQLEAHYAEKLNAAVEKLNAAILAVERSAAAAQAASKEAINKADDANEKRFNSVNEFRGTLTDQASKFIARTEVDAHTHAQGEKMSELGTRIERIESRGAGANSLWGYLVGGAGLLIALAGCAVGVVTFVLARMAKP